MGTAGVCVCVCGCVFVGVVGGVHLQNCAVKRGDSTHQCLFPGKIETWE